MDNVKGTKIYVYALIDENEQIIYIGKSNSPKVRLGQHKCNLNNNQLQMKILDYFYDVEQYWVSKFKKENHPLNNKELIIYSEKWEIGDIITTNEKIRYKVHDTQSNIIYDSVYKLSKVLKIDVGTLQYKLSNPERHQDYSQYKLIF